MEATRSAVGTGDPLADSRALVLGVRRETDTTAARQAVRGWDRETLADLPVPERRATWLNVYNAYAQLLLREDPTVLTGTLRRTLFFRRDQVPVAGRTVSLDDLEHGFLRGRTGWGLGYVPRLLPGAFERAVRVPLDPRVHFALNCGAASCPLVGAYSAAVDEELDRATRSYLDQECTYDTEAGVVRVSRLFSWYRGDFGGTTGVRAFLRRHDVLPADAEPTVEYAAYDWSPALGAFRE